MPFDTIIGQERPKRFLQAALRSQRLAHALLFHGEERIGKLLTARVLAQAVNCEAIPTLDPPDACGACRSCHQIETGAHPDVTILTATSGKGETDQTREIESRFIYRPLIGRRKIVIQDNADLLRRSEEHTSELQSLAYLVCRLLLEKKKNKKKEYDHEAE